MYDTALQCNMVRNMAKAYTPRPHGPRKRSTAPRPHERRATGAYPYFRIAQYRPELISYRDDPAPHPTLNAAIEAATRRGWTCYKVSQINADGSIEIAYVRSGD